jgi:hypothetical protein
MGLCTCLQEPQLPFCKCFASIMIIPSSSRLVENLILLFITLQVQLELF